MTLSWLKTMWRLKLMSRLKLVCNPKPQSMPKLLFHPQGLTLLSRHMIAANLSLSDGLFWFLPGPQYDYHVEQRPQVQKPKPRLPRFPGAATSPGSFSVKASGHTTHSSTVPRTHTRSQRSHLIASGAFCGAVITHVSYIIKSGSFVTCIWIVKPLLVCPAWKKL